MSIINRIKLIKPVGILLIICLTFIFWIIWGTGYFLPVTQIAEVSVEWKGNQYHPTDINEEEEHIKYAYRIDKSVARSERYDILYLLKGDKNKEYNVLVTADPEGERQLWIKNGYEIPLDGEITGGILRNGFIDKQIMNTIVELSKYPDIIVSKEVFISRKYSYPIFLCFNDCPVSGKYFGKICEVGDNLIIYTESTESISSGEDKVSLTFIKDKKIKKKLSKIINKKYD
ncbi:hypothetical protein DS742_13440 [Lacrimispora amygdalina]|uniref:Uncharacterized protein n=1 Tax=Lacrimispora amygdalina TaxID=253257 RepID=A0A3E2NBL6_9FIRM|nr:hypothetical protein [Clostridium indicum]RFZ78427.1 hypothetical protein DS742_13440 [Clostridium indicum]